MKQKTITRTELEEILRLGGTDPADMTIRGDYPGRGMGSATCLAVEVKLLSSVDDREKAFTPVEAVNAVIAAAQVHATLALTAAIAAGEARRMGGSERCVAGGDAVKRYQLKMRPVYVDALDASCRRHGCRETHSDDPRRLFDTREEAEYAAAHPGFLGAHGPRFEVVEVDE